MLKKVYSESELHSIGKQRVFDGTCNEAAFLMGGIGTGNFSIGARGDFRDWEIFNTPTKGNKMPYNFFAIRVKEEGKEPIAKVLESKINPPFSKSHGFFSPEAAGLPRFEKSEMKGEYPIVQIKLTDKKMPVEVTLEAFTPFAPLNPQDSGIPCAILSYRVKNITKHTVEASLVGSITNMTGFKSFRQFGGMEADSPEGNVNEYKEGNGFAGVRMYSSTLPANHLTNGDISIITTAKNITVKPEWLKGVWCDCIHDMWDDFCQDGRLEFKSEDVCQDVIKEPLNKSGSIGGYDTLQPEEEKEFRFIIAWHFPNRLKSWKQKCSCNSCECSKTQNYYVNLFENSWNAAEYVIKNFERLKDLTYKFHDALFNSTLPGYVIDAAASNICVLRSTTCFWLKDGKFFGWEGCFDEGGCCEGNCTHVWNYAQTMAFLFPTLEQDMRITEFNTETKKNGKMFFRANKYFNIPYDYHPAADGQMGCIIRLYREWKMSGDNAFLSSVWENAKRALDFAFEYWDSDKDFVLDSQQHNTYDIEFYGANSLVNSMFFGALKAASEMALAMGDKECADKYREAFDKGAEKMDRMLWGGEYYIQKLDDVNKYKYQYGTGCLSDHLFGQMLAHVAGLGHILPEEHVKSAVYSIFKYNFLEDFSEHNNVQRTYALNDEKGLVLCTWPKGGRPKLPFDYSDEVWTGIEYQVAAHLIYEGFVDEGLTIVKAVRDRHDGVKRNPWNEVECGNHYARSMASWALLTALSGFKVDMVNNVLEFNPVINKDNFSCFFSCGKAWGVFTQEKDKKSGEFKYKVDVLYGNLEGIKLVANGKVFA